MQGLILGFICIVSVEAQVKGFNCESVSLRLDMVRNEFLRLPKDQVLIAIARLGSGESDPKLNERRLFAMKAYLVARGVGKDRIVTGSGEPTDRNGIVQFYQNGKLVEEITASLGADIPVGICDNDEEDRKKYQLDGGSISPSLRVRVGCLSFPHLAMRARQMLPCSTV